MSYLEQAISTVPGFSEMYTLLKQNMVITGKSSSTLHNYSYQLAKLALHYNCVPQAISTEDIKTYIYILATRPNPPSESYLKFVIYGLRYIYKLYELQDKHALLPKMKNTRKLPVVLSREEMIRVISAAANKRQQLLLLLLYGCGLRCAEASKIKINDIDFDRRMLHVQNGKGGKQRYVPISTILLDEVADFVQQNPHSEYLLEREHHERKYCDKTLSTNRISQLVRRALRKAKISKKVSAHSLRHSFATHLLEDGLDIVTIKELLGHQKIETTMLYLHVAQCERSRGFSPLDTLYRSRVQFENLPSFISQHLPMHKNMFLAEYN